jgi:hypothetical protein
MSRIQEDQDSSSASKRDSMPWKYVRGGEAVRCARLDPVLGDLAGERLGLRVLGERQACPQASEGAPVEPMEDAPLLVALQVPPDLAAVLLHDAPERHGRELAVPELRHCGVCGHPVDPGTISDVLVPDHPQIDASEGRADLSSLQERREKPGLRQLV